MCINKKQNRERESKKNGIAEEKKLDNQHNDRRPLQTSQDIGLRRLWMQAWNGWIE